MRIQTTYKSTVEWVKTLIRSINIHLFKAYSIFLTMPLSRFFSHSHSLTPFLLSVTKKFWIKAASFATTVHGISENCVWEHFGLPFNRWLCGEKNVKFSKQRLIHARVSLVGPMVCIFRLFWLADLNAIANTVAHFLIFHEYWRTMATSTTTAPSKMMMMMIATTFTKRRPKQQSFSPFRPFHTHKRWINECARFNHWKVIWTLYNSKSICIVLLFTSGEIFFSFLLHLKYVNDTLEIFYVG